MITVTLGVANGKVQEAKDGKVRASPRRRNIKETPTVRSGAAGTPNLLTSRPQMKKIIIKALAMARRKPGMTKMMASIRRTPATKSILLITISRSQAS